MAMPLKQFRDNILEPNLKDLAANYADLSKGYNAASTVDAYPAHILHEANNQGIDVFATLGLTGVTGTNDGAFKAGLAKECPEFSLVRDIAKANKHAKLTLHAPAVNGSGDTAVQAKGFGMGEYGMGRFGGPEQLVVTDLNGTEHYLESLICASVSFLDGVAGQLGLRT